MAVFIPSLKPEDFHNSYGEMKVYEALRSLSDRYVIFYSLNWVGINESRTIGEADFVVLHPEKGVLVIEVKSGEIVYKDGEWIQTNMHSRMAKRIDPFGQARKSQFELRDRLFKSDCDFRLPMMCYCVWFPSVEMPDENLLPPEAAREIVLDKKSLVNPEKSISASFSFWGKKYQMVRLNVWQFQKVVDTLCPYFHVVPNLKAKMEELNASYIQLTNQQTALLDFLEEQQTATVHGLAGTGKTVLAVEKARRLASENESVLFLCYNRFLRDMLRKNDIIPNVVFHNFHSLAFEIMGSSDAPIDEILSEFEDYLEEDFDSDSWGYSNIIIDEGQDLDDRLLNRLYELVRNKHGCFYVFYDRNQYIMKNHLPQWIEDAECRLVLHKNCRNTAEVFRTSCSIMGLDKVFYNDIHGEVPMVKFYRTTLEMEDIVSNFMKRVTEEGLRPEDVVVLTAMTTKKTWLNARKEYGGWKLSLTGEPCKVLFTTIRKFKGLEAEAILIVDVSMSSLTVPENRKLLYVGSSRAKSLLNIAMLEDVEKGDMGDYIRRLAPGRNLPKNKNGLMRLLNISM